MASSQPQQSTSTAIDRLPSNEVLQNQGYVRYFVCATCCFGICVLMSIRINFNVVLDNLLVHEKQKLSLAHSWNFIQHKDGIDEVSRGIALATFYIGFVLGHLTFGLYTNRSNTPNLIGAVMAITASFQLFTPVFFYLGNLKLVGVIRFLDGICAAPSLPAFQVILSRWTPKSDIELFNSVAFSGINIGIASSMCFSGIISYQFGWKWTFYIFGASGLLWMFLWQHFIKHKPEFSRHIGQGELEYILSTRESFRNAAVGFPFTVMMKSRAIWAIVVARFTYSWGFYTFLLQLPHFCVKTLDFNLQTSGLLCGLSFLTLAVVAELSSRLLSKMFAKDILNKTAIRKLFCFIGFFGQALLTLSVTVVDNTFWKMFFIVCAIGMGGITMTSFLTNHLEVAAHFSAVIVGFSTTISSSSGAFSAVASGLLLPDDSIEAWNNVFYLCAGIYAFGGLFYLLLGSSKTHSWDIQIENDEN